MTVVRNVERGLLHSLAKEGHGTTPAEALVLKSSEHVRPLIDAEELRLDIKVGFVAVLSRRASGGYFWAVLSKRIHCPSVHVGLTHAARSKPAVILGQRSDWDKVISCIV